MSDNEDWGAAEPIRSAVHDLVGLVTKHFGVQQPASGTTPAHDAAVQQMNDAANAQRTQDATKSFIKPDIAATIRKKAASK